MGIKNYLIDGVSCAGKTTVCGELQRRGYHAVHGDRELAYWGDLNTGETLEGGSDAPRAWLWDVAKVKALAADQSHAATFFCGGSKNAARFLDLFDKVFVLQIDRETLERRLAARPQPSGEARHRKENPLRDANMRQTKVFPRTPSLSMLRLPS